MAKGKIVVITGASSGIGAATAELLSRTTDYQLVLVARRKDALDDVVARCGGKARAVVADMENRADVKRVAREWVDIWINNAGRGITRMPSELTDEDLDQMFSANVKTALYCMQAVLPQFKKRREGHFINVSSMLARIPSALHRSAYSASKFYLNAITAMLRDEVQQQFPGIAFSIVSPGMVATEFGVNAVHGGVDSRTLPYAQPVGEVAAVIADVIVSRAPDVYTTPGSRKRVADHYASIGTDP